MSHDFASRNFLEEVATAMLDSLFLSVRPLFDSNKKAFAIMFTTILKSIEAPNYARANLLMFHRFSKLAAIPLDVNVENFSVSFTKSKTKERTFWVL